MYARVERAAPAGERPQSAGHAEAQARELGELHEDLREEGERRGPVREHRGYVVGVGAERVVREEAGEAAEEEVHRRGEEERGEGAALADARPELEAGMASSTCDQLAAIGPIKQLHETRDPAWDTHSPQHH